MAKYIEEIDQILMDEASEEEHGGGYVPLKIHEEAFEYWRSGKLPEHFKIAQTYFEKQLKDDEWYKKYNGKYVAIMPDKEAIVDKDIDKLLKIAYDKWGYRPIFVSLVSRERVVTTLRPRLKHR